MKPVFLVGLVILILGVLSFFVPIPHSENHGIKVGDASIGVTTHHEDKAPVALSAVLVVGGIVLMAVGGRGK